MITKTFSHFNIRQIADSGQCFRMIPCPSDAGASAYSVISGTHFLRVEQQGNNVCFSCSDGEFPFWEQYFDLKTDYSAYIHAIDPADGYLSRAAAFGSGIRILNQDLWEMIITFIISQQKTIPAIRSLVEALSARYGTRYPVSPDAGSGSSDPGYFYAFPTPGELNRASLDDLLALKLGYRAKYIKRTCEDVYSGKLDLAHLRTLNEADAMDALLSCYGIGVKVANCISLFGLHHIDAFPVDTWIKKILLREYAPNSRCTGHVPETRLFDALIEENFSRYSGFAGVLQQYIFYYERETQKAADAQKAVSRSGVKKQS